MVEQLAAAMFKFRRQLLAARVAAIVAVVGKVVVVVAKLAKAVSKKTYAQLRVPPNEQPKVQLKVPVLLTQVTKAVEEKVAKGAQPHPHEHQL